MGNSNKLTKDKIFFFGLDELRCLAAFSVVFHHLEAFKFQNGIGSLYSNKWLKALISNLGHNGVICFFVLSGFLITYLLLAEKTKFAKIRIKDFYIRRILRIWPLYFLIVFIGFAIVPLISRLPLFSNQSYFPELIENINYLSLIWFILFASNFVLAFYKPVVGASQSWSVSVEEQFYLIWPWLVDKANSKKTLFYCILVLFSLKIGMNFLTDVFFGKHFWLSKMMIFFQIEYMCIGAVGAIVFFSNWHQKIKIGLEKPFTIFCITGFCIFEMLTYNHHIVLAILFLYFIYILIEKRVEVKGLNFLGKISYGIYMFHPLMMFVSYSLCLYAFPEAGVKFNILYYLATILSTIGISTISYNYFESYFLKFKSKYTFIASGSN